MATKIRLARAGSKKRPFYRIVVADSRSPRDGKFIEKIGTYNPLLSKDDENRITLQRDRAEHWLSVGAEPTERVSVFFTKAKIGNDNAHIKNINAKRDDVIKLKKAALETKKKEEAKSAAEAEKKSTA